jgi:ElaB/YqjD/DUF883 family membrane-anchored ribosome-binding protein
MPLLEDLLLRFRRIWSPPGGVVGQAGVPEEAGARLDDEIREVSAVLAQIDDEAAAVVASAGRQAASTLAAADAESARLVESARARLPQVRAQSAAARLHLRQTAIDHVLAESEARAREVGDHARARMPALVAQVVEEMLGSTAVEEDHARVVGGR